MSEDHLVSLYNFSRVEDNFMYVTLTFHNMSIISQSLLVLLDLRAFVVLRAFVG